MSHEDDANDHGGPRLPQPTMKEQTTVMSSAMVDAMAPMLYGAQLYEAEGRAWDLYVTTILGKLTSTSAGDALRYDAAIVGANHLLAARRQLFNELTMSERLRMASPDAATNHCGKPVSINGKDTGTLCVRTPGHSGTCY